MTTTPRYLVNFDARRIPWRTTDVLIVGGGVAGLRAALEAGKKSRVLLVMKRTLQDSNTAWAQGGVAAALDRGDSLASHVKDTMDAGKGIANAQVVRTVIREGAQRVKELIAWGTQFDRSSGAIRFAREGGHSRARILHAHGDATGAEIARALIERVRACANVEVLENTFVLDLLVKGGRCWGAIAAGPDGSRSGLSAGATILATGGCGQIYRETTNPEVATGDGLAMAHRAGAALEDMEFVQFHPTALYIAGAARALMSEAVRGEGAVLRDRFRRRFMPDYHPDAELAPRDTVSRAIVRQMRATDDTQVYLDLTHLPSAKVRDRFPGLAALCRSFGLDIARDPIPVRPAAHYMVGGVKTDLCGRTSLPGLWAAGECGCAEFHGANRLGSNSLLEGLVTGVRAANDAVRQPKPPPPLASLHSAAQTPPPADAPVDVVDLRAALKALMWREAGVERDAEGLQRAIRAIDFWKSYVLPREFRSVAAWELQNMLTVAGIIAKCALARDESRGTHFRTDFPETDDRRWRRHQVV
ncbi:MAG: L-aspartate oxidase [Planctomycetia bacterium]|nr:L-aspartate oxidase [Planctomycetia bacterium]